MRNQQATNQYLSSNSHLILLTKIFITFLLAIGIFILDMFTQLGIAGGTLYVSVVLMGLFYPDKLIGMYLGIISTALIVIGYFISPDGGEYWMILLNRSYSLLAVWVVAVGVYRQKTILKKLETYAQTLSDTNIHLEKKVDERTHELADALEHQLEVNEMKSRFVSLAAHDFRTPLTAILSSVSLISKYTETDQQEKRNKHIDRIKSSVSNLTNIINDFLSHDRLDQGKILAKKETFDFKNLCDQVIAELSVIKRKGQIIRHIHGGDQIVKDMDEKLLRNTMINLLSNAIKYSDEDQIIAINTDTHDNQLKIEVRDKGIGIPKEDQENIFKQFFRAQNTGSINGIGLGLNIVKHYVEMMGGSIEFTSEAAKGTTFLVEFPQTDS